jgi:hypothetical protein
MRSGENTCGIGSKEDLHKSDEVLNQMRLQRIGQESLNTYITHENLKMPIFPFSKRIIHGALLICFECGLRKILRRPGSRLQAEFSTAYNGEMVVLFPRGQSVRSMPFDA